MNELLAVVALLTAAFLAAWFFGRVFQGLKLQGYRRGYKMGYTKGVFDGASSALNPKNKQDRFVSASVVEDSNE